MTATGVVTDRRTSMSFHSRPLLWPWFNPAPQIPSLAGICRDLTALVTASLPLDLRDNHFPRRHRRSQTASPVKQTEANLDEFGIGAKVERCMKKLFSRKSREIRLAMFKIYLQNCAVLSNLCHLSLINSVNCGNFGGSVMLESSATSLLSLHTYGEVTSQ